MLRTLRTSSISAIIERLRPLLHIDPVAMLPPEIISEIFSYLTPPMLLEASRASKAWRASSLDTRLWKQKFSLEGWGLDMDEIRSFERRYNSPVKSRLQKGKPCSYQQAKKKRPRADVDGTEDSSYSRLSRNTPTQPDPPHKWNSEPDIGNESGHLKSAPHYDVEMFDVDSSAIASQSTGNLADSQMSPNANEVSFGGEDTEKPPINAQMRHSSDHSSDAELQDSRNSNSHLMIKTAPGASRLNYHHVFKQKRKLEDNWNAGSYQSFQLPHRDHPEEAHSECVYTIQYIGNYLVSGSRDRSLRIWDLETQRLVRRPLLGHTASVLCLQFDNRENEDIIISGSSDTDVILWQFSTGKLITKIPQAHRESVLNLKFDSRFLVTCSKDKTIKIWNRHELQPGDRDYPVKGAPNGGKCPSYILDLTNCGGPIDLENHFTPEQRKPLKAYSVLMSIDSHGAAVNAIHIFHDQLVSASGDRNVKVFDIHTGVCTAICRGHTKGIACVQYDGKRIVSGSSDNTIRIYDPATQAEVACLQGHTRLVRTIQSAFGDVPGSREQLENEAIEVDQQYFKAKSSGTLPSNDRRTRERNAGSKAPQDIMAVGAKLPPGGGGSRWGRIISGSYDETIIIWKKAADGRWVMGHKLRQEEALRAAGGPLISQSDLQSNPQNPQPPTHPNPQGNLQQQGHSSQPQPRPPRVPMTPLQYVQHAMQVGSATMQAGLQGVADYTAQLPQNPNQPPPSLPAQIQAYQQHISQQIYQHNLQQQQMATAAATNPASTPPPPLQIAAPSNSSLPAHQQQQQAGGLNPTAQNATVHNTANNAAPQNPAQPPPTPTAVPPPQPGANHHHHPATTVSQPNARVFKLQFDARRIICCSQDPKIVGWDFANGDEKIVECSGFFSAPQ